jgi:hypothetical protein
MQKNKALKQTERKKKITPNLASYSQQKMKTKNKHMKTELHKLAKKMQTACFMLLSIGYLQAQDILVAEYNFEADGQGWIHQALTSTGGLTANPSGGHLTSANPLLNFAPAGGTGSYRHNTPIDAGSWWMRSPGINLTAGKEYYVKFAVRLAGFTASANQRVQVRMGTNTQINNVGTIILSSQTLPSSAGSTYIEYTTGIYTAAITGLHYFSLCDFYSNNQGWACYYDGVRLFEVAPPANTWEGDVSNDWNNASNWSNNAVPVASDLVVIPQVSSPNVYPLISGASTSVSSLTIESNAILTVSGDASLSVSGDLINDGTMNVNSGGVLLQTGSSTASGSGTYNIQRQLPGSNLGFRFMGSSLKDLPVNSITGVTPSGPDGGQVTPMPNCNPNFVASGSPYGNILELRENPTSVLSNCAQSLWHVKSAGNFENGRGYAIRAQGGQTLTFTGTEINNGPVNISGLTRQPGTIIDHISDEVSRGWHMFSNPYPSPIVITGSTQLEPAGIDGQIQLFNSATGTWIAPAPPSTPVTIAPGQAFQIRKTTVGGTASFTFTNDMRVANVGAQFFSENNWYEHLLNISLFGNGFTDETKIFFNQHATTGFDPKWDANKLLGPVDHPALFTVAAAERMSYNGLPPLNEPISVNMNFYPGTAGTYTLYFDDLHSFPATAMIYLEDKKTGVWTNLRNQHTYAFHSNITDDIKRFVVHFEPGLEITATGETCSRNDGKLNIMNPSNETWQLNLSGTGVNRDLILQQGMNEITDLPYGVYNLSLQNNSFLTTTEAVINESVALDAAFELTTQDDLIVPMNELEARVLNPQENVEYTWLLNDLYVGEGQVLGFAVAEAGVYNLVLKANKADCQTINAMSFTAEGTTSIQESFINHKDLRAFPNPSSNIVTVLWSGQEKFENVLITNLAGRKQLELNISGRLQGNQVQIDVTQLNEGVYMLNLVSNGVIKTVSIVVTR